MTAGRADRIGAQDTRLAADDSVSPEQAEDTAATAFILGVGEATAAAIVAEAETEQRAKWMLKTARVFMNVGATPERIRGLARCEGYEFLGELADAMDAVIAVEAEQRAKWLLDGARMFLDLGVSPDEMRWWARNTGYECTAEIADAMDRLLSAEADQGL